MRSISVANIATLVLGAIACLNDAPAQTRSDNEASGTYAATQPVTSSDSGELGEVIVTGTKRAQSLQDVPISAVVKSSEALELGGVTKVADLQFSVPGFAITGPQTSGWIQLSMRGISTNTVSSGFSLGTGMYIDGVDQGPPIAFNQPLVDVGQIEVLRGPQGTLFGRNTIAGAFNITTRKPGDSFDVFGQVDLGNYHERYVQGAISGPLNDSMSVRLSLFDNNRDGFIKNVHTGGTVNDNHQGGGRLQLRFHPNEALTIDISADALTENDHFVYDKVLAPIGNSVNWTGEIPAGFYTTSLTFDDPEQRKLWGLQSNLTYRFDNGLTFTSVSGFRHGQDHVYEDTDHTSSNEQNYTSIKSFDQISQEFRLASPQALARHQFDYLVGLYASSLDQDEVNRYGYYEDTGIRYFGVGPGTGQFVPEILTSQSQIRTQQYAAFGNASYYVTNAFSINGGLRIGQERKQLASQESGLQRIFVFPATPYFEDSLQETDVSPTVGGNVALSGNTNLYAKVVRGFKSGGFNTGVFKGGNTNLQFKSEAVTSYESGLKGWLLDRKLLLSVATYFMDYRDLQVEVYTPPPPGTNLPGIRRYQNAATATIKGVELEVTARPVQAVTVNLGGSYNDAKFKHFVDPDPAGPVVYDGKFLPWAPVWSGYLNADYRFALGHGAQAFVFGEYTYRGSFYSFISNLPSDRPPSVGLLNGRAGVQLASGLELSLYGKNIAAKQYCTELWALASLGQYRCGVGDPRQYGLSISYRH